MTDVSPGTRTVLDAVYDLLVSAYASARLAAVDAAASGRDATPEDIATFVRYAEAAYGLLAGASPASENPAVTLLMMASLAERRALALITVDTPEEPMTVPDFNPAEGCDNGISEPCRDGDHEACGGEFWCEGCGEDVPCEDACHDEEGSDDD
jgi:hypothetical protein